MAKVTYTPAEFAAVFGKERTWGYRQLYAGRVKAITKLGQLQIPISEVDKLLNGAERYLGTPSHVERTAKRKAKKTTPVPKVLKKSAAMTMLLTVELPRPIARRLGLEGPQANQRVLEMLALEGYRAGELSRGQVSEMLRLEFNETEALLHRNRAFIQVTVEDLEQASANLRQFLGR